MGCKFLFKLNINNINSLVDNKEYYLNRGAYLTYTSAELESYYSTDREKILFNINNIGFDYVDVDYDKSILISDNYIIDNNFIPLEMYNDRDNLLSITLKDIKDNKTFNLLKDVNFSLMRQLVTFNQYSPAYNTNKSTNIAIDNFGYTYASERTDLTSQSLNTEYIVSDIFNSKKINTTAVNISDITSVFNSMEDSISINVF
jgi:hypothetical protein